MVRSVAGTPEFKQISALVRETTAGVTARASYRRLAIAPDRKALHAMPTSRRRLNPPVRILMGPGPSDIHPRVLQALAKPTVGHLDPYYLES